jgi:hypothetical protein
LQLVATGKMQLLAVAVQFLTDFLFWQPFAVAVGPNMVKKPDPTGLSNTICTHEDVFPQLLQPLNTAVVDVDRNVMRTWYV